jgi:excisionase family DNA binding protein
MKLFPSREACKILGIHPNTLRQWADDGRIEHIRTESGQRRYNVDAYLGQHEFSRIIYARVSSPGQKEDLDRQLKRLMQDYPQAEIVKDIGSGLNYKRKGLKALLERALNGDRLEVIVTHKDRIARFGFDIIEWLIEQRGGKIMVLDQTKGSPEQELVQDLMAIIHVFSSRLYGLRSDKDKIRKALSY